MAKRYQTEQKLARKDDPRTLGDMKTIQQLLQGAVKQLRPTLGDQKQAWFEAELLLAHILKLSRIELVTSSKLISPAKEKAFQILIKRRLKEEPIAYLLGHVPFFGKKFFVDKRVLIPRPESEWLIERSLEITHNTPTLVWDVGTGSGILALSISASDPQVNVIASDVSSGALTVAKHNAKQLAVANIRFMKGSLLTPTIKKYLITSKEKQILIVANLPYLPKEDKRKMRKQVTKYEPNSALFANDKGSALIKQLLQQLQPLIKDLLRPVHILLELDPPQSKTIQRFAHALFPSANIHPSMDFNQKNRFIEIAIPSSSPPKK